MIATKIMLHDKINRFQGFKILAHSDKIRQIVKGEIPTPVEWVIYPSNICGYRCGHCIMAREHQDHRAMLSKAAMERIPSDAVRNNIRCIIFSGGGDPLLNPLTNDVARRCKAAGILTGINNQGYLLDDATPYDFVRYSVDAATPETYQEIHRVPKGDGWERVNENIAKHKALRDQGHKIEMGLAFLITPLNFHEVYQFCEWASKYEPDFIHIRPAYLEADYLDKEYPGGGIHLKDQIIPNLREMAKRIKQEFPNAYFTIEKFEGFWTAKEYSKCRATPLMAVTSGDGAFLVCQDRGIMSNENYLRWGDYNKQSFGEIWGNQEHQKVIESIDLDTCPRCVESFYNTVIEKGFVEGDLMKLDLI